MLLVADCGGGAPQNSRVQCKNLHHSISALCVCEIVIVGAQRQPRFAMR